MAVQLVTLTLFIDLKVAETAKTRQTDIKNGRAG